MAQRADNNVYLSVDAVVVTAYFKSINIERSVSPQDTTAGANQHHVQRAAGLKDTMISGVLSYDDQDVDDYLTHLAPGQTVRVIFGPDGNAAGKPKHEQDFLIESISTEFTVEKNPIGFDFQFSGADTPISDMFEGDTF